MSDELTRAIAEAIIEEDVLDHHQWCESNYTSGCNCLSSRETTATKIAAALAPLIEARVREARADALTEAAEAWTQGAWASTPRRKDRVADRMAASQYAGDWLRERAEEARRG